VLIGTLLWAEYPSYISSNVAILAGITLSAVQSRLPNGELFGPRT